MMNPREKWLIGLLAASVLVNGLLGIGLGWACSIVGRGRITPRKCGRGRS